MSILSISKRIHINPILWIRKPEAQETEVVWSRSVSLSVGNLDLNSPDISTFCFSHSFFGRNYNSKVIY